MAQIRDQEPEHYALALTLALTEVRYGEATAVRSSDVDEESALIPVVRAQWHGIVGETQDGECAAVLARRRCGAATTCGSGPARSISPLGYGEPTEGASGTGRAELSSMSAPSISASASLT